MLIRKYSNSEKRKMKHWLQIKGLAPDGVINNDIFTTIVSEFLNVRATKTNSYSYLDDHILRFSSYGKCKNLKTKKQKVKDLSHNKKYSKNNKKKSFYLSREWRSLRVEALVKYGRKCCLCGRSPKEGVILHVDHIKPRSKYPKLELDIENLQILCEDCNLGKSNKYEEKWR